MPSDGTGHSKKGDSLFCERIEVRPDFIRLQKEAYPVTVLCAVMRVNRSGFHDYLDRFENHKDRSAFVTDSA